MVYHYINAVIHRLFDNIAINFNGARMRTLVQHSTSRGSEMATNSQPHSPLHRDGLLVKVARELEIIYERLGGPAQSDRDRTRHAIEISDTRDRYLL